MDTQVIVSKTHSQRGRNDEKIEPKHTNKAKVWTNLNEVEVKKQSKT